uniref:Uncharacterized protein n=1 Tax=Cacopsylla melanoneura TaxID=428564 RepID=A0A8D8UB89_9HEMI
MYAAVPAAVMELTGAPIPVAVPMESIVLAAPPAREPTVPTTPLPMELTGPLARELTVPATPFDRDLTAPLAWVPTAPSPPLIMLLTALNGLPDRPAPAAAGTSALYSSSATGSGIGLESDLVILARLLAAAEAVPSR